MEDRDDDDDDEALLYMWASSYRAGDDTHILGILFEPVVHVLTHRKQVVEAGSLTRRPVTLWDLERSWCKKKERDEGNRERQRRGRGQMKSRETGREEREEEAKKEVEVSNSTAAAEHHNTPVAMMSHLLEIQRPLQADRGPSWPC